MTGSATLTHIPVMVEQVILALRPHAGGTYVDCTFGQGGHTREILKLIAGSGRVIAFDKDPHAAATARTLAAADGRLIVIHSSYTCLQETLKAHGSFGKVDGILFDLGVSSVQLDDPARGFSFRADGPLDMRMDPSTGESASGWLNTAPEKQVAEVLRDYGEERFARRIARAIVTVRKQATIKTTRQLADIVVGASPTRERAKHPATRTFQAIRIYINRELDDLGQVLNEAVGALAPGGRLAVISFHSLEDRIVKRFIRDRSRAGDASGLPVAGTPLPAVLRPTGKLERPSVEEIQRNPRARSAILRVAEKVH